MTRKLDSLLHDDSDHRNQTAKRAKRNKTNETANYVYREITVNIDANLSVVFWITKLLIQANQNKGLQVAESLLALRLPVGVISVSND